MTNDLQELLKLKTLAGGAKNKGSIKNIQKGSGCGDDINIHDQVRENINTQVAGAKKKNIK